LSTIDEGTEVGLEDAGVLAGGSLEGTIEGFEDPEESGGLRGNAGGGDRLEMLPGTLSEPGAIRSVVGLEDLQEPDGLGEVELRLLDREHRGHLLLGRQGGDSLGHGDGEEGIGDEVGRLGRKPLQDSEPFLHPGLLLPQAPEDGMHGELLIPAEVIDEVEFLAEGGAAGGVIEAEAVELGLGPTPGFLDDPRFLFSPGLEREEPLEAVDEEEPAVDDADHQGVVGVGIGVERLGQEELGGDFGEGDFPQAHGRPPAFTSAGGRERIWKVG
jgi:hypothetical protein